jgi:hypothetical protein
MPDRRRSFPFYFGLTLAEMPHLHLFYQIPAATYTRDMPQQQLVLHKLRIATQSLHKSAVLAH